MRKKISGQYSEENELGENILKKSSKENSHLSAKK